MELTQKDKKTLSSNIKNILYDIQDDKYFYKLKLNSASEIYDYIDQNYETELYNNFEHPEETEDNSDELDHFTNEVLIPFISQEIRTQWDKIINKDSENYEDFIEWKISILNSLEEKLSDDFEKYSFSLDQHNARRTDSTYISFRSEHYRIDIPDSLKIRLSDHDNVFVVGLSLDYNYNKDIDKALSEILAYYKETLLPIIIEAHNSALDDSCQFCHKFITSDNELDHFYDEEGNQVEVDSITDKPVCTDCEDKLTKSLAKNLIEALLQLEI